MKRPTKRQLEVLRVIHDFATNEHRPPSMREIGKRLGISSVRGVADHVEVLERKGLLKRERYKTAALAVTDRGIRELGCAPVVEPSAGVVCGWCGAHYFGPECPFARCHEEAVGW